ncbi:MAG: citramalate synthase [Deltaproteobacteria bacterium]|nr:citramalate synthase [Deltaproteobacteria bacterium]
MTEKRKIEIYDTTLRDGTQARYINVSVADKILLTRKLDEFGIHYIEGGMPGSNPKDEQYFKDVQKLKLNNSKVVAFGSTARDVNDIENDLNLNKILESKVTVACIFGKTWRFHSKESLGITDETNQELIYKSVKFLKDKGLEVFFDAEHFFDGYKDDPEFAINMLKAAHDGGASRLVLCDTNGGALPDEITLIVKDVIEKTGANIAIHAHNDGDLAIANTLAAIEVGAMQVQGTINGLGERCGNANICSVIPNLVLKKDMNLGEINNNIENLSKLSLFFDEITNQIPNHRAPWVGSSAFAHKGGIHVSSVLKDPRMYEHIRPEEVGNERTVVVSDLAGKSNITYMAKKLGIDLPDNREFSGDFVQKIKTLEHEGLQFDGAEASFKLMLLGELDKYTPFFEIPYAKINDMFDENVDRYSEAVMKIKVGDEIEHTAADGNGPVNALDAALRKALSRFYPKLSEVHLLDYKVRVLDGHDGTMSKVRVLIESSDGDEIWSTVGVSPDIIKASLTAISDSLNYKIYKDTLKS